MELGLRSGRPAAPPVRAPRSRSGSSASSTNSSRHPAAALDAEQLGRRREARVAPGRPARGRRTRRVDPDQRLQRPARALPHRDHRAPVGPAADQRDDVEPAAQGLLGGPQVGAQQQQRGVQQHRAGVPTVGRRLGPGGGDHDRRRVRHPVQHLAAHRRAGSGSAGTPCPAPRPSARRPTIGARTRRQPQIGHSQSTCSRPHQAQLSVPARSAYRVAGPAQNVQRAGSRQSWQTRATR